MAKMLVEQNVGTETPKEKWMMLCQMIVEANWSEEKFQRTLKWFLLNKSYPAWTIADWFQYNVKLYPVQWMKNEIAKMGNPPEAWKKFDRYKVDGVVVCKWKDGVEIPLPTVA